MIDLTFSSYHTNSFSYCLMIHPQMLGNIEEEQVVRKILEHFKLWVEPIPRAPPQVPE